MKNNNDIAVLIVVFTFANYIMLRKILLELLKEWDQEKQKEKIFIKKV